MRQLGKMPRNRIPLVALLLLGSIILFTQNSSRAQSFGVTSTSLSISAAPNGSTNQYLEMYVPPTDTVTIYLTISGTDSSLFSLQKSQVTIYGYKDTAVIYGNDIVTFRPTSVGTYHAQVNLSDHNGTNYTVTLTGTCAFPPVKELEGDDSAVVQAMVGETKCSSLRLINSNGTGTMTISAVTVTGPTASQISVTGISLPDSIGAGRTLTFNFCFSPTAIGNSLDSFAISYTDINGTAQTYRGRISTFATANVVNCIQIEGDSSEFYMYPGEVRTRDYKLVNNATSSITLANIYLATGSAAHYAIISPATPVTIAGGGSVPMIVQYTADASYQGVAFNAKAILTVTTPDTCANELDFYGADIQPPPSVDSTSVGLLADSTQELDFDASAYQTWVYLTVVNNSGSDEKIDNISFSNYEMRLTLLTPDSSIPFVLHNGASMKLLLELVDSTSKSHDDTLIITSEHALTSTMYHIHIGKTAGVSIEQITNVSLTVNPNPSHGNMTVGITGMRNANIQVLDILGRVVAQANNVGSTWAWNGMMGSQSAQNGTYILRATGIGASGKSVTQSSRFVISR